MQPTEATLQYLSNMLSELEPYLRSPELFWPLSSQTSAATQDRLTLGNLLLSQDKVKAAEQNLDAQQESIFQNSNQIWEEALVEWKSAIHKKAEHEIKSRMQLWHAYLIDLEADQGDPFDYRYEVRNRVIIERLFDLGISRDQSKNELQRLDLLNQSLASPADFIWPSSLQSQYPHQRYWFLHRLPRKTDS